ncbi:hypothetical protein FF1_000642 [Malus domestica]
MPLPSSLSLQTLAPPNADAIPKPHQTLPQNLTLFQLLPLQHFLTITISKLSLQTKNPKLQAPLLPIPNSKAVSTTVFLSSRNLYQCITDHTRLGRPHSRAWNETAQNTL